VPSTSRTKKIEMTFLFEAEFRGIFDSPYVEVERIGNR